MPGVVVFHGGVVLRKRGITGNPVICPYSAGKRKEGRSLILNYRRTAPLSEGPLPLVTPGEVTEDWLSHMPITGAV